MSGLVDHFGNVFFVFVKTRFNLWEQSGPLVTTFDSGPKDSGFEALMRLYLNIPEQDVQTPTCSLTALWMKVSAGH